MVARHVVFSSSLEFYEDIVEKRARRPGSTQRVEFQMIAFANLRSAIHMRAFEAVNLIPTKKVHIILVLTGSEDFHNSHALMQP